MDGEERTVHVWLVHLVPSVGMARKEFSKIFIS